MADYGSILRRCVIEEHSSRRRDRVAGFYFIARNDVIAHIPRALILLYVWRQQSLLRILDEFPGELSKSRRYAKATGFSQGRKS